MFLKKWLPGKMILAEFVVIMKMSEIMSHFKFAISTSAAVVLCLLLADKQLIFSNQKNQFFFQKEVDNQHNGNSLWVGFSFVLRTKMYDSKWFTCMHVSTMGKTIFPKKNNFSKKKMVFNTNSIRTSLVGLAW